MSKRASSGGGGAAGALREGAVRPSLQPAPSEGVFPTQPNTWTTPIKNDPSTPNPAVQGVAAAPDPNPALEGAPEAAMPGPLTGPSGFGPDAPFEPPRADPWGAGPQQPPAETGGM